MRDEELRKKMQEWDPARRDEGPDPALPRRIRRRLEGSAAPEWLGGRQGLAGLVDRLLELTTLPGRRMVVVAATLVVAVLLGAWVMRRPVSDPVSENPIAGATTQHPETAEAVQVVLTASNGVRVYWNYEPASPHEN